jgi:endonuclease YncB( thermonuclease family)
LKEIDAPELNQPFGNRSRQSLAQICAKKTARVSWTERDRNGRLLARVWCGGIDANAEQVRRGMAWVFDRYVKDRSLYPL